MNHFNFYHQRVIAQRDILQKLYRERLLTRRILGGINRLPDSSTTNSARFRFLSLEARLNEAIVRSERTERRLSLIGSVTRYDSSGNNTNLPNNSDGNGNNTNSPNSDGSGNNTNSSNTSQTTNRSIYNFDNITFVFFSI